MTRKEKIGIAVLVAIFAVLGVVLAVKLKPRGPSRDYPDSVVVQQRILNLQKDN